MVTKSVSCKLAIQVFGYEPIVPTYITDKLTKKVKNTLIIFLSVIAKIRHLQDYQLRLSYNMLPCPSGLDIANCLKYFSQVLLSKIEIL